MFQPGVERVARLKHGIPSDFGEAMMVVETNVICGDFLKPETIMIYDWNAHESVCLKSMMREEEPVKKPRKRRLSGKEKTEKQV